MYFNKRYYCKTTTKTLIKEIGTSDYNPFKNSCSKELTDSEKTIIQMICKDLGTKEIAQLLNISIRTVDAHRRNIHDKLETTSSIGIMLHALKMGIVPINQIL